MTLAKDRALEALRHVRDGTAEFLGELEVPDGRLAVTRLNRSPFIDLGLEVGQEGLPCYRVDLDNGDVEPSAVAILLDGDVPRDGDVETLIEVLNYDFGITTTDAAKVFTKAGLAAQIERATDDHQRERLRALDPDDPEVQFVLRWPLVQPVVDGRPVLSPARIGRVAPDDAPVLVVAGVATSPFRVHGLPSTLSLVTGRDGRRALVADVGATVARLQANRVAGSPFDDPAGDPLPTQLSSQEDVFGIWERRHPDDERVRVTMRSDWLQALESPESMSEEGGAGVYRVGEIMAPSGRLAVADPRARGRVDELAIDVPSHRGLAVFGVVHDSQPSGLLVRLAEGRPTSWVPAVPDWPVWNGIDHGVVALFDSETPPMSDEQLDGLLAAVGPFGLTDLTGAENDTLAWLTSIGGDVPVGVLVGLDAERRAVCVLIDAGMPSLDEFVPPRELDIDTNLKDHHTLNQLADDIERIRLAASIFLNAAEEDSARSFAESLLSRAEIMAGRLAMLGNNPDPD